MTKYLNESDVAAIKATLERHPEVSQTQLSNHFGVRRQVINNIAAGRCWLMVKPSEPIPPDELPPRANEAKSADAQKQVDAVVDHWANALLARPDKLRSMLEKTVRKWPKARIDAAYQKVPKSQED